MNSHRRYIHPTLLVLFVTILSSLFSCEESNLEPPFTPSEGINIIVGNRAIITSDMIDYYDHSTGLFVFNYDLSSELRHYDASKFWITDDKVVIFEGATRINCPCGVDSTVKTELEAGYYDFTMRLIRSQANSIYYFSDEDERDNALFINALKKQQKYREGLSVNIQEIKRIDYNHIQLSLKITNLDTLNYYIPDPLKMGADLHQKLSSGLGLTNRDDYKLTSDSIKIFHQLTNKAGKTPSLEDGYWDRNWLSLIESKEDLFMTIDYKQFDSVAPGNYCVSFHFSGLRVDIANEDLELENGCLWIGDIGISEELILQ